MIGLGESDIDNVRPHIRQTDERDRQTDSAREDDPNDDQNCRSDPLFCREPEDESIREQKND